MEKLGPGTYEVRVTDAAPAEADNTGSVGIAFRFECSDGYIFWTNWATERNIERFKKNCATLGMTEAQLLSIQTEDDVDKIDEIFKGARCQIVVEDSGDKYGTQVKWVNDPDGRGGRKPIQQSTKRKLAAMFSGNSITGALTSAPRYTDPALQGNQRDLITDDDVPF